MKRLRFVLLAVLLLLAASVAFVYIAIPAKITVSRVVTAKIPVNRASDFFTLKTLARNWMPGKETDGCFCTDGTCFCFFDNGSETVAVKTTIGTKQQFGYIYINPVSFDSAIINWTITLPAGSSPLSRISAYFTARDLKKKIIRYVNELTSYTSNDLHLYGLQPVKERVTDTLSLSQKKVFDHYPSPSEINALTAELEPYIIRNGATVTRPAMMHVLQTGSTQFETMVALPINRPVPNSGNFILKRMPPGKIISARIKGGYFTIRNGLQQMEQYKSDKQLSSPAIPYQSMVTNRVTEPDTLKWITQLYYPVF